VVSIVGEFDQQLDHFDKVAIRLVKSVLSDLQTSIFIHLQTCFIRGYVAQLPKRIPQDEGGMQVLAGLAKLQDPYSEHPRQAKPAGKMIALN
jgi:hypothetical protein